MALILLDRVKVNTTTTGAGTVVLASTAPAGYQSFAVIGDNNTTYYTIAGQTTSEWEVGIGTYYLANSSLSRTTILSSSNANAAVTFTAGTKDVFVTYPAERAIYADSSNITTITNFASANVLITGGKVNSAALTGGSINNMTIGATTANTGSFTNITATTINSTSTTLLATSGGNVGIGNTAPVLKFNVASNGYNIRTASADNLYGYNLGRNTSDGLLYFYGDQSGYVGYVFTGINGDQVRITSTASANNYVQITGGAGVGPTISAAGAGTNIDIKLTPKGTGYANITSGGVKFPDATVQTTAAGIVAGNSSIIINNINITANATIAANTNGFSVGPINTANGVSVTISSGSRWVVI